MRERNANKAGTKNGANAAETETTRTASERKRVWVATHASTQNIHNIEVADNKQQTNRNQKYEKRCKFLMHK